MAIDLEELERLHAEAAGTPYKAKGDWIYAQSVSHKRTFSRRPMAYTIDNRDGRYKPTETAASIVAACNAVPELIKMYRYADDEAADANSAWQKVRRENLALRERVRGLERQRKELAELAIYNNGCFDCPLEDVCLYKEELVRDSAVCSRLLIEWVEAAKEAGE